MYLLMVESTQSASATWITAGIHPVMPLGSQRFARIQKGAQRGKHTERGFDCSWETLGAHGSSHAPEQIEAQHRIDALRSQRYVGDGPSDIHSVRSLNVNYDNLLRFRDGHEIQIRLAVPTPYVQHPPTHRYIRIWTFRCIRARPTLLPRYTSPTTNRHGVDENGPRGCVISDDSCLRMGGLRMAPIPGPTPASRSFWPTRLPQPHIGGPATP